MAQGIDSKFTDEIKGWLDNDSTQRDYEQGAMMLLKLTRNQMQYRANMAHLNYPTTQLLITTQLKRFLAFRLAQLTHAQVEEMAATVKEIVEEHHLTTSKKKEWVPGRREDHDDLPVEVQVLYVENLTILHKMRELHLQLRELSGAGRSKAVCEDSDRYPFLKELIALDKQYHENWERYDHFVLNQ